MGATYSMSLEMQRQERKSEGVKVGERLDMTRLTWKWREPCRKSEKEMNSDNNQRSWKEDLKTWMRTVAPADTLISVLWEPKQKIQLSHAVPGLLTHGNYEIIHGGCCKPIHFIVVCFIAIGKYRLFFSPFLRLLWLFQDLCISMYN